MKLLVFSPQSTLSSTLTGRTLKLIEPLKEKRVLQLYCLHGHIKRRFSENYDGFKINYFGQMLVKKMKNYKAYYSLVKTLRLFLSATFKETNILINNLDCNLVYFVKNQPIHILPTLVCKLLGKKIILDIDDLEYKSNKKFRKILKICDMILPYFSNKIFVCSPYLFNKYQNLRKVVYLPTPLENIKIKSRKDKEKCIIYFGSVSAHSGHRVDLLLDSIRQLAEKKIYVRTYILGDGTDLIDLKKEYSDLVKNGIISFLGRYNKKILSRFLEKNCIIVDPIDDTQQNKAKSSSRFLIAAYTKKPYIPIRVRSSIQEYYLPKKFSGFVENMDSSSLSRKILYFFNKRKIVFEKDYVFITEFEKNKIQDKFMEELFDLK